MKMLLYNKIERIRNLHLRKYINKNTFSVNEYEIHIYSRARQKRDMFVVDI